jgi:LacI family transcriptional regulator, galactose operon repressor
VDNRGGARAATEHLISHGRRRILCLSGPVDAAPAAERVEGWADALRAAGLTPRKRMVWQAPFGRQDGYRVARQMLADKDADAVFVTSDEQALGVLRALRDLGLRCPEDVAVASFDGITSAAFSTPALTTMAQPFDQLGRESLGVLLGRIDQPDQAVSRTVLPVTLVRRGSCGCPDVSGTE